MDIQKMAISKGHVFREGDKPERQPRWRVVRYRMNQLGKMVHEALLPSGEFGWPRRDESSDLSIRWFKTSGEAQCAAVEARSWRGLDLEFDVVSIETACGQIA